jgi:hypothetical protein
MLFLPTKVGSISSSSIFWKTWKGLLLMYPHCCARDLQNLITHLSDLQLIIELPAAGPGPLELPLFLHCSTAWNLLLPPVPACGTAASRLPAWHPDKPEHRTQVLLSFLSLGGAENWVFAPNGTATCGRERCKGWPNGGSFLPFLALCWLGVTAS